MLLEYKPSDLPLFLLGIALLVLTGGCYANDRMPPVIDGKKLLEQQCIPDNPPRYLIIDLSGGPTATNYPYRFSEEPLDLSSDLCRTTELWLRRIPPGTFIMGSPESEFGRIPALERQHLVTISQEFYIGVFEVTRRQWELVMGLLPRDYGEDRDAGDGREKEFLPVVHVSYSDIRGTLLGAGWPEQGHLVDGNSFLGILRERTGLELDLPTEAQWEYACRAGTTSALNSGKELMPEALLDEATGDANLNEVGFCSSSYRQNGKESEYDYVMVGGFLPNHWGLYDMHGNVEEWCLDWIPGIYSRHVEKYPADGLTPLVDPVGYQSNEKGLLRHSPETPFRVVRGGIFSPELCRSAARKGADYRHGSTWIGFRLTSNGLVTTEAPSLTDGENVRTEWEASLEALQRIPENPPQYLVIDLSGGSEATRYPYRHSEIPPDLSDERCRTTELWLRRIPPGTFVMGSPEREVGRTPDEQQHLVTLSRDFYIGVFEVTRRQWELVVGSLPAAYSHKSNRIYMEDTRCDDERMATPVAEVAYSVIRGNDVGAGWPEQGHLVDGNSFLGILRERTGLEFDLPTEAQWEYACRAGTTTSLNSGEDMLIVTDRDSRDTHLNKVGCYEFNCPYVNGRQCPTVVGSFQPNRWGLYDMHGNVWEWCLDWHSPESFSLNDVRTPIVDPVGGRRHSQPKSSGKEESRVARGGCYARGPVFCRAAERGGFLPFPWLGRPDLGFRLVCNELPQVLMDEAQP